MPPGAWWRSRRNGPCRTFRTPALTTNRRVTDRPGVPGPGAPLAAGPGNRWQLRTSPHRDLVWDPRSSSDEILADIFNISYSMLIFICDCPKVAPVIRTKTTGSFPRPGPLREMLTARAAGKHIDPVKLAAARRQAVTDVVRFQDHHGLDPCDGEQGQLSFLDVSGLSGFHGDPPPFEPADRTAAGLPALDAASMGMRSNDGPIEYADDGPTASRLADFGAALQHRPRARRHAFLTVPSPETLVMSLRTSHYGSREDYLAAAAAALNKLYRRYTGAGHRIQVDAPGLAMTRHVEFPNLGLPEWRNITAMGVDAINAALDGIDPRQVELHICWGNYEGPHDRDVPLAEFLGLVYKVAARTLVLDNTRHHRQELEVFKQYPLPDDWSLALGVIDTYADVEDAERVASHLIQAARIVGEERLAYATTRCGWGTMGLAPWNPPLAFIARKTAVQAEAARRANEQLFG